MSYVVDSLSLLARIAKAVLPSVVKIVSIASSGNAHLNEGLSSKTKSGKEGHGISKVIKSSKLPEMSYVLPPKIKTYY